MTLNISSTSTLHSNMLSNFYESGPTVVYCLLVITFGVD